MKYRILFAIVALLTVATFASAKTNAKAPLEVRLAQTGGGGNDLYYFSGPVSVQYALQIDNPTGETFRLTRLNLRTQGPGGYTLRTGDSPLKHTIPPGTTTMSLSAWARSRGGFIHSNEPVSILGTAYFDGPGGHFVKQFTQYIPQ
jgi:hypothetical protein